MYKEQFDIGSAELVIHTLNPLKEELLEQIFREIQFLRYDLNVNIHNSSGYRFNTGNVSTPIYVTKQFILFLESCISYTKLTNGIFSPFFDSSGSKVTNVSSVVTFDDESVNKSTHLFFDSSVMLQAYIVDHIYEILKTNKVKSFLLKTSSYYRCYGRQNWVCEFNVEENIIELTIHNQAIGLHYNSSKESKKVYYCICLRNTCLLTKITSEDVFLKSPFMSAKEYSKQTGVEIILLDKNGKSIRS